MHLRVFIRVYLRSTKDGQSPASAAEEEETNWQRNETCFLYILMKIAKKNQILTAGKEIEFFNQKQTAMNFCKVEL